MVHSRNALNNTLFGNIGHNVLDGGLGQDTLIGLAGNDTYLVDDMGDTIIEAANEGNDTVQTSVTWTLADNLENLTLIGNSAINGTGNSLDNVLKGNSARNILTGGSGNDTYFVGSGDIVMEQANAGVDTVVSDVSWTLGNNIENLTLTGTLAINGVGNTLNNVLTGNSANNTLTGDLGNDTYLMQQGWGKDTIVDYDKSSGNVDVVLFGEGISKDQLWFSKKGNDLEVTLLGTTDKLVVSNWYKGNAYHIEQFKTADGEVLDHNKVAQLVQAMSTMPTPSTTSGHSLSSSQHQRLEETMTICWG